MKLNLMRLQIIIGILSLLLMCPSLSPISVYASESTKLVSLKAENGTLKEVLTEIANDTGYRILLNEEWESTPVTIELRNETLRNALGRSLKGLNYAVTWNESSKTISLFICHPGKCSGTMLDVSLPAEKLDVSHSAQNWDVSLSAEETEFVQPSSTIVE